MNVIDWIMMSLDKPMIVPLLILDTVVWVAYIMIGAVAFLSGAVYKHIELRSWISIIVIDSN